MSFKNMRNTKPYKLPKMLTCEEREVDLALVKRYIDKHAEYVQRYKYLENLYKGFHDIYNQPEKEEWKPDNRMAVNFPKYITDTFTGYAYGMPIKRTIDDEKNAEIFSKFDELNSMTDEDYTLATYSCIYGHCFEYFYQSEEAETRVKPLKPSHCFVVYDDTLRHKAMFGVRFAYTEDRELYGEYFTRDEIVEFHGNKTESKSNPYGKIPLVEYVMNDNRMSIFEEIAPMVETYNKVIGEKANDVDAFAEAYLAIIGAEVDDEQIYRIRDDRVINLYGTDDAKQIVTQFLTKPTADGTQENLLDRLEKLIYQTSMVANISDESFGNSSGTALAYKLHSMSNLALTMDRKMQKSQTKRYKLFCTLKNNISNSEAYKDIKYTFTRNVPRNLLEESQIATQLEGVVSKETQLKALSLIDNVKDEIERLEKENKTPTMTADYIQKQQEQNEQENATNSQEEKKSINEQ